MLATDRPVSWLSETKGEKLKPASKTGWLAWPCITVAESSVRGKRFPQWHEPEMNHFCMDGPGTPLEYGAAAGRAFTEDE